MKEVFLSQRDFAKVASVSTVTLQRLIQDKVIKVDPVSKKIPVSQYRNILAKNIRSYKANSTLVIGAFSDDNSKKDIYESVEHLVAGYQQPHFQSLSDVYHAIDVNDDDVSKIEGSMQSDYNKSIMKEFSTRYKNIVNSYESTVLGSREVNSEDAGALYKLPYYVVDELFTYGRVVTDLSDDELKEIHKLLSGVVRMNVKVQETLDTRFKKLMDELKLTTNDGLLFTRYDLTPDFFKGSGAVYDLFFKGTDNPTQLQYVGKSFDTVLIKSELTQMRQNVENLLSNGFVVSAILDCVEIPMFDFEDFVTSSVAELSELMYSGFFANVVFAMSETTYNKSIPSSLKNIVLAAQSAAKFDVSFI